MEIQNQILRLLGTLADSHLAKSALTGVSTKTIANLMARAKANGLEGAEALKVVHEQLERIGAAGKLAELFGDQQVKAFLLPFLANIEEYKRIKEAVNNSGKEVIDLDHVIQMAGPQAQKRLFNELRIQKMREIGDAFNSWLPTVNLYLLKLRRNMKALEQTSPGLKEKILSFGAAGVLAAAGLGVLGLAIPAIAAGIGVMQEELAKVIEEAGIDLDASDWTQLWQAINWMIANGIPWATDPQFADPETLGRIAQVKQIWELFADKTLLQNNLVFPEIETATNRLAITDNADGTLTIDTAQTWLWRGLFRYSSDDFDVADRTFASIADKTYHVRWHAPGTGTALPVETYPNGRFELADMDGLSETDAQYDTTFDRMLIARIVTDGANVATITNLANAAQLSAVKYVTVGFASIVAGGAATRNAAPVQLNWARTSEQVLITLKNVSVVSGAALAGSADWNSQHPATRYEAGPDLIECRNYDATNSNGTQGVWSILAKA